MSKQNLNPNAPTPLPGPSSGADIPATTGEFAFFPDGRTKYLHSERRFAVTHMRDGLEADTSTLANRVVEVLRGQKFPQILALHVAEYAAAHGTKGKDGGWITTLTSNAEFVPKLRDCLLRIGQEMIPILEREQAGGFLRREDLHLDAMLQRKKPTRQALGELLKTDFGLNDGQRSIAYSQLVPIIKLSIAQALMDAGETASPKSHQRTVVELLGRELPFVSGPIPRLRLAVRFEASPTEEIVRHVERVSALPPVPLVPTQQAYVGRLDGRFRWQLATLAEDANRSVRSLPENGAHEKLCAVFDRLWNTPNIAVYLNYFGNEQIVMGRILEGIRRGRIDLHCISCPDYSGRVNEGTGKWEFDFNSLGDGIGLVAKKGFRWVEAWANALKPAIPDVRLTHIMPTFEVPDGFKARVAEGVLPRTEAVARITRSGEAIVARYRDMGIDAVGVTSDELIGDEIFVQQRMLLAERMRQAAEHDASTQGLLKRIFESRRGLYFSWQAHLDGEDDPQFIDRMIRTVVPNHAGEYRLVGRLLAAPSERAPVPLILSYDSAIMGENYGFDGTPAMYGHDTSSLDYLGAQD